MKIDYGSVLTRAWNLTWKNRILWFFGFLIALVSEFGANGSNALNLQNRLSTEDFTGGSEYLPPELKNIFDWVDHIDWNTAWAYIWIAVGCCLIVWIALSVLSIIGLGGLIKSILKADSGEPVILGDAWALGRRYFGRLLAVSVVDFLVRLAVATSFFLIFMLVFLLPLSGGHEIFQSVFLIPLFLCPMFCGLYVIILVVSFYLYFVKLAVLVEDMGVGASFRRAARLLRGSIVPILLIGLIIFALSLGVNFLGTMVAAPALGLFLAALWPMMTETGAISMPLLYGAGFLFLITIPIGWLISSIWVTWQNSIYTLVYKQLISTPENPALHA